MVECVLALGLEEDDELDINEESLGTSANVGCGGESVVVQPPGHVLTVTVVCCSHVKQVAEYVVEKSEVEEVDVDGS